MFLVITYQRCTLHSHIFYSMKQITELHNDGKVSNLIYAFSSFKDIESLATTMVETEKHLVFPLVYRIIELALLLPVSTASVERAFSAMKIIKSKLRSKMNDTWFNDLMICYTEREIFKGLDDDAIIKRFQAMKYRKLQLPRSN